MSLLFSPTGIISLKGQHHQSPRSRIPADAYSGPFQQTASPLKKLSIFTFQCALITEINSLPSQSLLYHKLILRYSYFSARGQRKIFLISDEEYSSEYF